MPTTPCRPTLGRLARSVIMSSGFGGDAAAPQPEACADLGADGQGGRRLAPTTAHPSSLAEHPLCRQTPEVGAGCGKPARPDLCGGRPATDVPTANAAESELAPVSGW